MKFKINFMISWPCPRGCAKKTHAEVFELFLEVFIRVNTIEIEKQASLEAEEWQLKDEED